MNLNKIADAMPHERRGMKMDVQPISPIPMAKYPFSLAKMIDSDLRSDQQNADEFKDAGWICKVHRNKATGI